MRGRPWGDRRGSGDARRTVGRPTGRRPSHRGGGSVRQRL